MSVSTTNASAPIQQRSLSMYTLLGAFQSALWFFFFPSFVRPYWETFFEKYSNNRQQEVILWAVGFPYLIFYMLVVALPCYFILSDVEFIQQYKLSKDPWPWQHKSTTSSSKQPIIDDEQRQQREQQFLRRTVKSIKLDFFCLSIFLPTLIYIKPIILPSHVMSFSTDDFPMPSIQTAATLVSLGVIHEFGFYWTHRLMHTYPSLYKYHKVHHEYKQNNVLASQHFHPIDFLISIAIPVIMTTVIVRPHAFTQFQFGFWVLTANFDEHLGYAFPWSAVRWFPWSAGTDAHAYHHHVNMGCYGSKLSVWDWVFGTDRHYEEWRKKWWGLVD